MSRGAGVRIADGFTKLRKPEGRSSSPPTLQLWKHLWAEQTGGSRPHRAPGGASTFPGNCREAINSTALTPHVGLLERTQSLTADSNKGVEDLSEGTFRPQKGKSRASPWLDTATLPQHT